MKLGNLAVVDEIEDTEDMFQHIAGHGVIPDVYANSR